MGDGRFARDKSNVDRTKRFSTGYLHCVPVKEEATKIMAVTL